MTNVMFETYEETEPVAEGVLEESPEVLELIEKLGLKGQRILLSKDTDTGSTVRCPYRRMQKDEEFVFRTLCPAVFDHKEFPNPLPLRIMQILSHAVDLNFFREIQIWAAESAAVRDPVLVGIHRPEGTWTDHLYILVRWGKELDEMPALIKHATEVWRKRMATQLTEAKSKIEGCLAKIKACDPIELGRDGSESVSLYGVF